VSPPGRPGRQRELELRVNPIACEAHGVCLELLPELLSPDPWGYPVIRPGPIPVRLLALARRAVTACPTLALLLTEHQPRQPRPTEPQPNQPEPGHRRPGHAQPGQR
jgi:ferredoxin